MWLETSNENALLEHILPSHAMPKFDYDICGQSYKHFALVNYDSRVINTSKLLIFTTVETQITIVDHL